MSNNAPDYEDNLVFPPQEIKSQDDIKHQDTRSSDVLIKAVEKCEKLEQENQQLKELLLECQQSFGGIRVQIEEFEYSMARKTAQIAIDEIDNAIGEK